MSFSSKTSGLCKAIRISLVSSVKEISCVNLSLQNVEHKYFFKLKFTINKHTDTPQSLIDEMKNDALITISNPTECAKLLGIFFSKSSRDSTE